MNPIQTVDSPRTHKLKNTGYEDMDSDLDTVRGYVVYRNICVICSNIHNYLSIYYHLYKFYLFQAQILKVVLNSRG